MHHYDIILFDLDGTLMDSSSGVLHSFVHAMKHFGVDLDPSTLMHLIGPPLVDSFTEYLAAHHVPNLEASVEKAILLFREEYNRAGKFEKGLYPGMTPMLAALQQKGYRLGLATSKVRPSAVEIMEHFGLAPYFTIMEGASLDGSCRHKKDVILRALSQFQDMDPRKVILVGDTHYDMEGAKAIGIDAMGVLWGYGTKEVLASYNPVYIAETATDVVDFFTK